MGERETLGGRSEHFGDHVAFSFHSQQELSGPGSLGGQMQRRFQGAGDTAVPK